MLVMLRRRDRVAITPLLLVVLAAVSLALAARPATASSSPIVVSFEKHWVEPGHYLGTTGDGGAIEMWVYGSSVVGNVQKFSATLQISVAGHSLRAVLKGKFNFSTGRVELNGTVVDGWLAGARVHEESRYAGDDPDTGGPIFVGTVRLMPASA